jgi:hypothetical protein
MTVYTAVLFVHAIAVLVLTAALTMEGWTLMQLRRAAHPADVRPWIGATQTIGIAAICSLVIIYVTGAYLTESLHAWDYAWPRFAVLEIVLFAIFGVLTGRRMRKIRRNALGNKGDLSQWSALVQSFFFKISLSTRIWIVIGTLLLTAAKPGLQESLAIVVGSLILGPVFSFVSFGRHSVA